MSETPYDVALAALTPKQRLFVAHYLACLNGAEAARRAGYPAASARQVASENLAKPDIRRAVDAGLDLVSMPAVEILARLTAIARCSIADVLSLPGPGAEGEPFARLGFDLARAQETGAIHLVRSVREGRYGLEIELYSAHEALRDLARIRGLMVERRELSGPGGGPIPVETFAGALATAYGDEP